MREFKTYNKTFIKSSNNSHMLFLRYGYALIGFTLLTMLFFILTKHTFMIMPLIKSILISLLTAIVIDYLINIIKKNNRFSDIFLKDYIQIDALIIGLIGINTNYVVLIIATCISIIIKNIFNNYKISSALFGILLIIIYNYYYLDTVSPLVNFRSLEHTGTFKEIVKSLGGIKDYLFGIVYLSPIISIIAFIYLFYKKSIKYSMVISYILTFSVIMFFYGLFNDMIWLMLFELVCGNILFYVAFTMSDYIVTPTLNETQIIYGIILAIISSILRFIIPELAIIIPFILGPIILTKPLERISPKLKYNKKLYYLVLGILAIIVIISTTLLIILI